MVEPITPTPVTTPPGHSDPARRMEVASTTQTVDKPDFAKAPFRPIINITDYYSRARNLIDDHNPGTRNQLNADHQLIELEKDLATRILGKNKQKTEQQKELNKELNALIEELTNSNWPTGKGEEFHQLAMRNDLPKKSYVKKLNKLLLINAVIERSLHPRRVLRQGHEDITDDFELIRNIEWKKKHDIDEKPPEITEEECPKILQLLTRLYSDELAQRPGSTINLCITNIINEQNIQLNSYADDRDSTMLLRNRIGLRMIQEKIKDEIAKISGFLKKPVYALLENRYVAAVGSILLAFLVNIASDKYKDANTPTTNTTTNTQSIKPSNTNYNNSKLPEGAAVTWVKLKPDQKTINFQLLTQTKDDKLANYTVFSRTNASGIKALQISDYKAEDTETSLVIKFIGAVRSIIAETTNVNNLSISTCIAAPGHLALQNRDLAAYVLNAKNRTEGDGPDALVIVLNRSAIEKAKNNGDYTGLLRDLKTAYPKLIPAYRTTTIGGKEVKIYDIDKRITKIMTSSN